MAARTIINAESPKTQSIEAVKGLLSWRGRAADPMPSFIEMGEGESRLVLVLSNKRDAYYCVTAKDCSCPARNWHPNGPCKHMRRYFAEQQTTKPEAAIKKPNTGAWHGRNGPIIEDGERPFAKAASSIPLVDTLGDPTARDIAYHSIKADREMWPAEV